MSAPIAGIAVTLFWLACIRLYMRRLQRSVASAATLNLSDQTPQEGT